MAGDDQWAKPSAEYLQGYTDGVIAALERVAVKQPTPHECRVEIGRIDNAMTEAIALALRAQIRRRGGGPTLIGA